MTNRVEELLDNAVNNIFLSVQEERGIKSGDVTPEQMVTLIYEERILSNLICEILEHQESKN